MESKFHSLLIKAGFKCRAGNYNLKKDDIEFYYSHLYDGEDKLLCCRTQKQTSRISRNESDEYEFVYKKENETFEKFVINYTDSHLNFLEPGEELRGAASMIDTGLF